ncbi:extracellular solute-binding protein [Oceanospirillaceae bacterium]|nr:extracellular solute-binding protein [Oceanospirillaceae bacterium]MDC1424657.1 extracellular solute-binding protein [Oceanospirillaceae bacterium]|tara:strand:- start:244 stop:1356 length:1113 start_codon:yes stop_codon:yes gene_type:complete
MSKLVKGLTLAALVSSTPVALAGSHAEVNVVSWGGAYTESQKKGYGDPYQEKSGVKINWLDYSGGLGAIRSQVEAGAITWDIIDVYAKDTIVGCDEGLFVEFDFDNDFPAGSDGSKASNDFFTEMPSKCAVGNILYSWNYGFNTNTFPSSNEPKTIQDFFDKDKFSGTRGIYSGAMSNLEIALVADGVPAADVYDYMDENGTDRAFAKLSELCANDGCWFWSGGAQPPEALVAGEVSMSTAWNGRLFNAMVAEKSPIKMVWDGQVLDYEYFVLVNGGPNQAEAMKALQYFTGSEGLAGSAKYISYAPFRKSSLDLIQDPWFEGPDGKLDIMPHMPTAPANTNNYILMNGEWWADNETDVNDQWEAWKAAL